MIVNLEQNSDRQNFLLIDILSSYKETQNSRQSRVTLNQIIKMKPSSLREHLHISFTRI